MRRATNYLFKVVFIELDDRIRLYSLDPYTAVYHEAGEALAVDQDHAGVHRPRVVDGLAREAARCNKDALIGLP